MARSRGQASQCTRKEKIDECRTEHEGKCRSKTQKLRDLRYKAKGEAHEDALWKKDTTPGKTGSIEERDRSYSGEIDPEGGGSSTRSVSRDTVDKVYANLSYRDALVNAKEEQKDSVAKRKEQKELTMKEAQLKKKMDSQDPRLKKKVDS